MLDNHLERSRLFEEVRGSRHNDELFFTTQLGERGAIDPSRHSEVPQLEGDNGDPSRHSEVPQREGDNSDSSRHSKVPPQLAERVQDRHWTDSPWRRASKRWGR